MQIGARNPFLAISSSPQLLPAYFSASPSSEPAGSADVRKSSGMARLREGKSTTKPRTQSDGKNKAKGKAKINKGNEPSELVTDAQPEDPTLLKDVSSFLSDLTLGRQPERSSPVAKKAAKQKHDSERQKRDSKTSPQTRRRPQAVEAASSNSSPEKLQTNAASSASLTSGSVPSHKRHKFIVEPNSRWYATASALVSPSSPSPAPTPSQLSELSSRAARLLAQDAEAYHASNAGVGSSGDAKFLETVLKGGTLSDRLSALTLLVQGSPVHNARPLETLRGMMERKGGGGREEGLRAARCVVDWWVGGGGPGRKLRYFRDQPLLNPGVTDVHLALWYFEDWLKKYFFSVLQVLEVFTLDPLPYVRTQSLAFITTLLREQPEQEQNLLRLLVNKLGDTEKAVCSRASYHLLQVLQAHPEMKAVIVREVKALAFRPASSAASSTVHAGKATEKKQGTHIKFTDEPSVEGKAKNKDQTQRGQGRGKALERWNSHAWYHISVTLNQIVLTPSDANQAVARMLIAMYFEMFEEVLGAERKNGTGEEKNAGDVDSKGEGQDEEGSKRKDKGKKARQKEVKGAAGFAEVEDATSRLVSAILTGVNRALPFAKEDAASDDIFKAHIDTLFLITHTSTFNISLQALTLIFHITSSLASHSSSTNSSAAAFANSLTDRFYRTLYTSLTDVRLGESNKQAMYLNLLFKALKADKNIERVKAFVRRFVQVLTVGTGGGGSAEFVTGGSYLLGELFQTVSSLRGLLNGERRSKVSEAETYDPRKRDPQFAHASATPMYELLPLLHHYHPAVSLHARQLLTSSPITASPDLALNTLSHFLDRFVYKNPKKPKAKGASAMQPAFSANDRSGSVKMTKGEVADEGGLMVNEESWWNRRVEDVPVDQVFFHKYFTRKKERTDEKAAKVGKRKGRGDASDSEGSTSNNEEPEAASGDEAGPADHDEEEEGEDSDEEETEIWKAMKATMPAELDDDGLMEGSEDEDEDEVPLDLESGGNDDDEDDQVEQSEKEAGKDEAHSEADDFSLAEASDAEDLLPLDTEIPMGLVEYDGSDAEGSDQEEVWGGIGEDGSKAKKRKRGEEKGSARSRKKKLKSLPTFASYDDYARMIEDGPEDNV
ncbi:CBF-domain-containing protein [Laetiporus sulphureus 93-53]|uniref:CBF-domain-containing protein n=1 Tax=Laetiporus sulphureus 93-53 TaxID=1314785 RepID=A0A165BZ20_9APHY|nr:CBF-domain-containing protein [Laetiporus sulphureus 93-53]KZT01908.1 CBF-domain-containing protein [Laetiporus sulphureus 93-53]